jgi:GT2 family glycosyltransferase
VSTAGPDLVVVIVTWNSAGEIRAALNSVLADLASTALDWRVIVVDSASTDGTPELIRADYPQVDLVASAENLGFGRANNLGLTRAGFGTEKSPRAGYLLNPDTITHPGATQILFDALMSADDIGWAGARLEYGDGSFQHGAFRFPGLRQLWAEFFPTPGRWIEGPFNGRYPRALYDAGEPFDVDFTLGATMMLRGEMIRQTGMFDLQFFMYCEEIDWAWRANRAGWRVVCAPKAVVTHLGGQSTSKIRPQSVINLWTSRMQLYVKYYPKWKVVLASKLIAAGMARKVKAERDPELRSAYETVRYTAIGMR